MLKNLTLFHADPADLGDSHQLEADLQLRPFVPTAPTQQLSAGWVPPRGHEHGDLLVRCGGRRHWLLKLAIEQRSVPGKTLAKRVDEMAKLIEEQTGRKPNKKARKDLKEEALLELLPRAFPRRTDVFVWVDAHTGILAIDTASASRADLVASAFIECAETPLHGPQTTITPASAMSVWLLNGEADDDGFRIGRNCELQGGEDGRAVRYRNHDLDPDDMKGHIDAGKVPVSLALSYGDRVSFVLDDQLRLKKLAILDAALVGSAQEGVDAFDGTLALATGELTPLIDALVAALGGRLQPKPESTTEGEKP